MPAFTKLQGPAGVPVGEVRFNELDNKPKPLAPGTEIHIVFKDGSERKFLNVIEYSTVESNDITGDAQISFVSEVTLEGRFTQAQSAFDVQRQARRRMTVVVFFSEVRCYSVVEVL